MKILSKIDMRTVSWPSGLRRQTQVLVDCVRAGSNPALIIRVHGCTFEFSFCLSFLPFFCHTGSSYKRFFYYKKKAFFVSLPTPPPSSAPLPRVRGSLNSFCLSFILVLLTHPSESLFTYVVLIGFIMKL